jgi:hypothetical protein
MEDMMAGLRLRRSETEDDGGGDDVGMGVGHKRKESTGVLATPTHIDKRTRQRSPLDLPSPHELRDQHRRGMIINGTSRRHGDDGDGFGDETEEEVSESGKGGHDELRTVRRGGERYDDDDDRDGEEGVLLKSPDAKLGELYTTIDGYLQTLSSIKDSFASSRHNTPTK